MWMCWRIGGGNENRENYDKPWDLGVLKRPHKTVLVWKECSNSRVLTWRYHPFVNPTQYPTSHLQQLGNGNSRITSFYRKVTCGKATFHSYPSLWEDCLCEQIRPANVASHVSPSVKAPCFAPCMFSGWPPNPVPVSWIKWKTWKPKTGLKHIVQTTEPSERWFLMVPRCSSALLQLGLGFEMEQDTDHFCLSLATGTAEPPSDGENLRGLYTTCREQIPSTRFQAHLSTSNSYLGKPVYFFIVYCTCCTFSPVNKRSCGFSNFTELT